MLVSVSNLYTFVLTFGAISYVTPRVAPFFAFNSPISDQNSVSLQSYKEDVGECKPDCESEIFCDGEILHDVQTTTRKIYNDSKSFVDSKLRFSEAEIVKKYKALKQQSNGKLTDDQVEQFLNENFYHPLDHQHMGLEEWVPEDFKQNLVGVKWVENIGDKEYRKFALELNEKWKILAAKVSADVKENSDRYSLIYLPHGFIKAGGRFREMYYWDSYWVIRGLLLCHMPNTVRGIIENMIHLVKLYGHVPNGSRKYYIQRSQPPLLIQMASSYYSATQDDEFIRKNMMHFENEFLYWHTNRMVEIHKNGRVYKLARYNAVSCTPRPESYREDFNMYKELPQTEEEKKRFYTGMKSGAESGWDFSSRHVRAPDNSNNAELKHIDTQSFIYVDLNSILHANAVVLSEWYRYFKDEIKANKYKVIADELQEAIDNVLWNEEVGIWLDWDLKMNKSRNYYYASNLTPLWTGSYNKLLSGLVEKVIVYLMKSGIIGVDLSYPFWAVPTSMNTTIEQWDFPNGWAPLQAIVIQGLERTEHPIARYIAFNMAQRWMDTTYVGFRRKGVMFEKYSSVDLGTCGGGGEYDPQIGFGWTNGFVFEVLDTWGRHLVSRPVY